MLRIFSVVFNIFNFLLDMAYNCIFLHKEFPLFWNKYPGRERRMRAHLTHNAQLMGIHLPQYFLLDASGTKYCIALPSKEHKYSLIYIVKTH